MAALRVTVRQGRPAETRAAVAVALPMTEGLPLTRLAIDALRAFTPPGRPLSIWVVALGSCEETRAALLADATLSVVLVDGDLPDHGSVRNGLGLDLCVAAMVADPAPWLFVLHNDAVPVDPLWLAALCGTPHEAATTRVSNAAMHCSGFLISRRLLDTLHTTFLPSADFALDAGEQVSAALRAAGRPWHALPSHAHRPVDRPQAPPRPPKPAAPDCAAGTCLLGPDSWLRPVQADVTLDPVSGRPRYVHKGGGSTMAADAMARWVAYARRALALPSTEVCAPVRQHAG